MLAFCFFSGRFSQIYFTLKFSIFQIRNNDFMLVSWGTSEICFCMLLLFHVLTSCFRLLAHSSTVTHFPFRAQTGSQNWWFRARGTPLYAPGSPSHIGAILGGSRGGSWGACWGGFGAPRWSQDGPKRLQDGPKMAPRRSKMANMSPKMRNMRPKMPKMRAKMAPSRSKMRNLGPKTLPELHFSAQDAPAGASGT